MSAATQQQVTPELRRWIIEQAEAGCLPEDVLKAMVASGWKEDVALEAMEQTLRSRLAERREELPPPTAVPEPPVDEGASRIVIDGHAIDIVVHLKAPRVVVFGNLLSPQECDGLMTLAKPRLERSETVDNATGGSEINESRTSDGMFFARGETPLIQQIEKRIAKLVHWPVDHGEGLQILRYRPGAQYKPHHDYFDPIHAGTPKILERGGQRVATLVMYLNRPERGGATTFPDAGFEVAPVRGSAVFFSYDRPHKVTKTLHGGAPVLAGEKWVATKWLRQGIFN
jgi:prolyl 4-hydroxylase